MSKRRDARRRSKGSSQGLLATARFVLVERRRRLQFFLDREKLPLVAGLPPVNVRQESGERISDGALNRAPVFQAGGCRVIVNVFGVARTNCV